MSSLSQSASSTQDSTTGNLPTYYPDPAGGPLPPSSLLYQVIWTLVLVLCIIITGLIVVRSRARRRYLAVLRAADNDYEDTGHALRQGSRYAALPRPVLSDTWIVGYPVKQSQASTWKEVMPVSAEYLQNDDPTSPSTTLQMSVLLAMPTAHTKMHDSFSSLTLGTAQLDVKSPIP